MAVVGDSGDGRVGRDSPAPPRRVEYATATERGDRVEASKPSYPDTATCLPGNWPTLLEVSDSTPSVSVVIPTLNEAENLRAVLRDLPLEYQVIVVDGHSTDGTIEVARALRPDASVIFQTGLGKGGALAEGFHLATGDVIVTLDADRSAVPSEIPRFVGALASGADFAKGSRYLAGGGSDDLTHLRSFGNRALTRLVNFLYDTDYTDLCYGYNAFWRRVVPLLHVERTGFEVETLIALRVAKAGLAVTEVPSYERARGNGVGKLHTFRDGWRVLGAILRERWRFGRPARRDDGVVAPAHPAIPGVFDGTATPSPPPGRREGQVLPSRSGPPATTPTARRRLDVNRARRTRPHSRAGAAAAPKSVSRP